MGLFRIPSQFSSIITIIEFVARIKFIKLRYPLQKLDRAPGREAEVNPLCRSPGGTAQPNEGSDIFLSPRQDVISSQSLVQIMTFESSINRLNYFKIVILIYTDIVLIIQAEIKLFSGADDGELNIKGSSRGRGCPARAGRGMIFLGNELAACGDMNLGLLEKGK